MKRQSIAIIAGVMTSLALCTQAQAQVSAVDSVMHHTKHHRFSLGGYGEVAFTRNFYSDNVYRYRTPETYKNDPSHGRFDIPHAVIYMSYDFGKGWRWGTEIEFEHGGSGVSVEKEWEEGGEWEQEVEKGGEVELEQFWLQKTFAPWANVRVGHIVVPVGLNNARHEPLNFFTVYRPEGENTILPSTWHDTGISFWGRTKSWRYELQVVAGLDAFLFDRDTWVHSGSHSPFEFKTANKYGVAARVDNYSVPGLRLGVSGYFGQSMHNSFPHDMESKGQIYRKVKGNVMIGSLDFTWNRFNWILRGQADYGYLSDAAMLSNIKANSKAGSAPYKKSPVGKNAVAMGVEAGYDLFSQCPKLRQDGQKFYVFGRYEYYNSYIPDHRQNHYEYTGRQRVAVGINYFPIPQIAVKMDYSQRLFKSPYNNEPSLNIGIAYAGFFL